MTATRRRSARRTHASGGQPQPAKKGTEVPAPLPEWRWRTFPVYFAFALGAFIAAYVGVLAGIAEERSGNQTPVLVLFVSVALLMGFGMSRITTRWLLTRRFARNRNREP
jgi:hypothetical protein